MAAAGALNSNLEKMAAYMDRVGLDSHAAFFRASLADPAKAAKRSGGSQAHPSQLPNPALRRDVIGVLDTVAEKTEEGDHRGACRLL